MAQKAPPKLRAIVDLADKGVVLGYEDDPAKLSAYIAGLKMDSRTFVFHRDPVLVGPRNAFFIVAVYTNLRDRPIHALYCRLRLSPVNRAMTSFAQRPIMPGQRVGFVFQVQRSVTPQVAHFNFSETASGLDAVGQAITQHVSKEFLAGLHSAAVTGVAGGLKSESGVVQADMQPDHFEKPSDPLQFIEAAKTWLPRRR